MRPVFAVYSTFLQRAYDQLIHDAAMPQLHLTLAVDRAGIVGDDGETHQGVFDVSMLNTIPNTTIFSPTYFEGLRKSLSTAVYICDSLAVVRYPRGGELYRPDDFTSESIAYNIYGNQNSSNLLITYGRLFSYACKAKEKLAEQGIDVCILKLCKIKPIDKDAVEFASNYQNIWFFEEGIKNGSIARNFSDMLVHTNFKGSYRIKAIDDKFVKQMSVSEALSMLKLDDNGMVDVITTDLKEID
jgi:1-deoxy-D-xylulose-5-phosphate synthase